MKVYNNISELMTLESCVKKDGRNLLPSDLTIIKNASLVVDNDKVIWVGETSSLPTIFSGVENTYDLTDYCITPSLIDSHTHLIFGGNRASEYSMRLNGADYQAIAQSGGGILFTMNSTNTLSDQDLYDLAKERIIRIHSLGVSTIEIKSGYSLTFDGEYRLSKIIAKLKNEFSGKVRIFNTFMAAHAVPKSYKNSSDYISSVVLPLMEKLSSESLIDACDIFHEVGYFSKEDVVTLFNKAISLNLKLKIHADEFNDNNGAALAASYGALSADHLLATSDEGAKALANSNTVATLLPGTGLFLGKPHANAKQLLSNGCKVSIASDYNPGSCHCDNLLLLASISAPMYPLNMAQMWCAITFNAAGALGLQNLGALVEGYIADFNIYKCKSISEITYNWGKNLIVDKDSF